MTSTYMYRWQWHTRSTWSLHPLGLFARLRPLRLEVCISVGVAAAVLWCGVVQLSEWLQFVSHDVRDNAFTQVCPCVCFVWPFCVCFVCMYACLGYVCCGAVCECMLPHSHAMKLLMLLLQGNTMWVTMPAASPDDPTKRFVHARLNNSPDTVR